MRTFIAAVAGIVIGAVVTLSSSSSSSPQPEQCVTVVESSTFHGAKNYRLMEWQHHYGYNHPQHS